MTVKPYVQPITPSTDVNDYDPDLMQKREEGRAERDTQAIMREIIDRYWVAWRALALMDEGLTKEEALRQAEEEG